jgi:hypothetical protein
MSGAVAAHAAYNGAGTQGLAVTNKLNDAGDVTSVFWNKNDTTRQLLHGSSYIEVVSSGSSGRTNTFGSTRIFTVNNDIDLLSDLYLDINFSVDISAGSPSAAPAGTVAERLRLFDYEMVPTFAYQIIDRVEFMVGTQIWHTLTGEDIKVLNYTSRTPSANIEHAHSLSSQRYHLGTHDAGVGQVVDPSFAVGLPVVGSTLSDTVRTVVWIPALCSNMVNSIRSFSNAKEHGYLMAAAPQQSVKIRLIFKSNSDLARINSNFPIPTTSAAITPVVQDTSFNTGFSGVTDSSGGTVTASGLAFYGDANNESVSTLRERYPFKSVYLDFSRNTNVATSGTASAVTLRTSISSVRMFAKQIMLCKEERDQIRNIPNGIPYRIKMSQSVRATLPTTGTEVTVDLDSFSLYASHLLINIDMSRNCIVRDMELKLNSSSFSGTIPNSMLINNMSDHLGIHTPPSIVASHVSFGDRWHYMDGCEEQGEHFGENPTLVFPLASTAFSGSAVPLNRFDSIRLIIRFTGTPAAYGSYSFTGKTSGITVTCVGETTVLYKGGAATLAMY